MMTQTEIETSTSFLLTFDTHTSFTDLIWLILKKTQVQTNNSASFLKRWRIRVGGFARLALSFI